MSTTTGMMGGRASPAKHTTTAGSLVQQLANVDQQVAGRRMANGGGHEVSGIASVVFQRWSAAEEATFVVAERALRKALDLDPATVNATVEVLASKAMLTREAVRDQVVRRLLAPAQLEVGRLVALATDGLRVANAEAACAQLIRRVFEVHGTFGKQVEAAVDSALASGVVLQRIDDVARDSDGSLAVLAAALRSLEGRAAAEPARIDKDLVEVEQVVARQQETLRVVARETGRATLFGVSRAVSSMKCEVAVRIPQLSNQKATLLYLPAVRARVADLERACADRAGKLEARARDVRFAYDELVARQAEARRREEERSRLRLVGVPGVAERRAAVERVVAAVEPGLERQLRDLIAVEAPAPRVLEDVLALVRERVREQAPIESVDDALLHDRDPKAVAEALHAELLDAEVPIALEPGADRRCFGKWQCKVLRFAEGSRLAELLATHCGYDRTAFAMDGSPDRIEYLVWQSGVSIHETKLFHGVEVAYLDETSDRGASPVQTFSDALLASLVAPAAAAE